MNMRKRTCLSAVAIVCSSICVAISASANYGGGSGPLGDIDGDGWVGVLDLAAFVDCMAGPAAPPDPTPPATAEQCLEAFDTDLDADVDWGDYGSFVALGGHTPIPLRDSLGEELQITSTMPYSGRQTCGDCHEIGAITNAYHFQQGRTDSGGNIIMQDDFFGDGRFFIRSAGMYGKWCPAASDASQLAGKTNFNESAIDKTSFLFVGLCGICHPGGGLGEFDRDGFPYYDSATGQFGYELSGADPTYDGDYTVLNPTGDVLNPAPWDVTGVSGPDCLYCHRRQRSVDGAMNMNWTWRAATLRGGANLVDDQGASVPAYAAAATAGQGWFSNIELADVPPGQPPMATTLQIDYAVGLTDGSLGDEEDGSLHIAPHTLGHAPKDYACWGCHAMAEQKKRGQSWFDPEWDVHYRGENNLGDEDPANDVAAGHSRVCNTCHPGDVDHRIAKGNAFAGSVQNETDYVGFRSCRDCHLSEINGKPNPQKDPDAPEPLFWLHTDELTEPMMALLSCQACHIPYAATHADMVVDHAVTGSTVSYTTADFLSADPQDPSDPDRSRWYPAFKHKVDSDGVERLFPVKILNSVWWADWDRNGTPEDLSDDVIAPVPLWKVRQVTGSAPLPGVTDDNGDGKPEVNRLAEIDTYIQALKGHDSYGRQVAANPVLVKGERVWYEDPAAPENVSSFEYQDTAIAVEALHPFSMDHNVLPREEAWGVDEAGNAACDFCHRWSNGGQNTDVIDRLVLVDPFGLDGLPVYKSVRELTGIDPP